MEEWHTMSRGVLRRFRGLGDRRSCRNFRGRSRRDRRSWREFRGRRGVQDFFLLPMGRPVGSFVVSSVRHLEYLYQSHCYYSRVGQKVNRASRFQIAYSVYSCLWRTYYTLIVQVYSIRQRVPCRLSRMTSAETDARIGLELSAQFERRAARYNAQSVPNDAPASQCDA
jgi:hypothetical protein